MTYATRSRTVVAASFYQTEDHNVKKQISAQARVAELVKKYGSYRKAANVIGLPHPYLYRIGTGESRPSENALLSMGLKTETAMYQRA